MFSSLFWFRSPQSASPLVHLSPVFRLSQSLFFNRVCVVGVGTKNEDGLYTGVNSPFRQSRKAVFVHGVVKRWGWILSPSCGALLTCGEIHLPCHWPAGSANVERTTESPFNIGAVRLNLREAEYVIVHKGTESDIFIWLLISSKQISKSSYDFFGLTGCLLSLAQIVGKLTFTLHLYSNYIGITIVFGWSKCLLKLGYGPPSC